MSPFYIRPDYSDLVEAGNLGGYEFLFESRTVLGQSSMDVVLAAWDFEWLDEIEVSYEIAFKENLLRVKNGEGTESELISLARSELTAYLSVMQDDPLLPRKLWPHWYRGEQVLKLHQEFTGALAHRFGESDAIPRHPPDESTTAYRLPTPDVPHAPVRGEHQFSGEIYWTKQTTAVVCFIHCRFR